MLTGRRAFDGQNPASVIAAILEREAPSVAAVAPRALDRVLQKCLAKDPSERWQSARDIRHALDLVDEAPAGADSVTQSLADAGRRVARRVRRGVRDRRGALGDVAEASRRRAQPSELSPRAACGSRVPVLRGEWRKRHLSRRPERRVRGGHERDATAVDSHAGFADRP